MVRFSLLPTALAFIAACPATAQSTPDGPTGPVERKYYADGPETTQQITSAAACDHKGNVCDVWLPRNASASAPLPVILWANGTSSQPVTPDIYGTYLSHLASWGFIVVSTRDGKTGYGDTVNEALAWLRGQAVDPNSPLFQKADLSRVGVGGHSQGATGAVNAMLKSKGAIKTAIAYHLPAQLYCNPADLCLLTKDLAAATSGSVFYVSGTLDPVATDGQLGGSQLNSLTAYYNATPAPLLKAKGLVKGTSHTDLLGQPGCGPVSLTYRATCILGAYGYFGLPTAWFAWQLKGDRDAGKAFTSSSGEFYSAAAWSGQASNVP